jgi:plastocyanin
VASATFEPVFLAERFTWWAEGCSPRAVRRRKMQIHRSFAATGAAVVVAVAVLVSLSAGARNARADNPVLTADVGLGDAFVISLVDAAGADVKHIDAGTYTLIVHDRSVHHNFHLYGPGVGVATGSDTVGDQTFTITLVDGTYTYVCDPHALTMRGLFTVGSVTAPPPGKLTASILRGSKIALGPLDSVSSGTYVITVSDRSTKDGFRLSGPGVTRSTGTRFTGSVRWTVTLRVGTYEFGSTRIPKLHRTFTVYG